MKAKELIESLKAFDGDLDVVYISDTDFTDGEITYCYKESHNDYIAIG